MSATSMHFDPERMAYGGVEVGVDLWRVSLSRLAGGFEGLLRHK